MLDEEPETDDGYVTLVNMKEGDNGECIETNEHTGKWAWRHPHTDGTLTHTPLRGDVRMLNVDFAYEEGKEVLHDISELTKFSKEKASDGCGVMELLSTAPDTVTIHDSFCEILLQLRDEELLRMPGDLVETLIRMEGRGTVPHVLAVRMRRLFGVVG